MRSSPILLSRQHKVPYEQKKREFHTKNKDRDCANTVEMNWLQILMKTNEGKMELWFCDLSSSAASKMTQSGIKSDGFALAFCYDWFWRNIAVLAMNLCCCHPPLHILMEMIISQRVIWKLLSIDDCKLHIPYTSVFALCAYRNRINGFSAFDVSPHKNNSSIPYEHILVSIKRERFSIAVPAESKRNPSSLFS